MPSVKPGVSPLSVEEEEEEAIQLLSVKITMMLRVRP